MNGRLLCLVLSLPLILGADVNCSSMAMRCQVWCEYGNALDDHGCPTCNCKPACPCGTDCKANGAAGKCTAKGECVPAISATVNDCSTTVPTTECRDMSCPNYCANGAMKDANGCPTCQCNPVCTCGDKCSLSNGMGGLCNEDGVCTDNMSPKCKPVCSNLLCRMFCQYGNVVDENGCQLCACNPAPLPCPCGQPCKMNTGKEGRCLKDDVTCGPMDRVLADPAMSVCGTKCPDMLCLMYCPFGNVVDANGCSTCGCNPDPTLSCPCGNSCVTRAQEKGICLRDGSCVNSALVDAKPCHVCEPLMCKMLCPFGNVVDENGCQKCECNPAPEKCMCGERCKTESAEGICQEDGKCLVTDVMPKCKAPCPTVMCMMFCEHGNMMDANTGCPTCRCNPAPEPCVCGQPCSTEKANGTCQANGVCAVVKQAPLCDKPACPAVLCALYCPNGNARDNNGCLSCRCNPEDPTPATCRCGEKCKMEGERVGICQKDGTCGAIQATGALMCDQTCPALMCNLYCPHGNAVDEYGCATCACVPRRHNCTCGKGCMMENGGRGVCQEDGMTCAVNIMEPKCRKKPACPAVRCMMFCANGNHVDENGCPTCTCKDPPVFNNTGCKCGDPCAISANARGVCQADGKCVARDVAVPCDQPHCSALLCMMFCPYGNVIAENGCSTCACLPPPAECPCGQKCKLADGVVGLCQADGKCSANANGVACSKPECPLKKCLKACPEGYSIDAKGCPGCECAAKTEPATCGCGQSCVMKDGNKGYCQKDSVCSTTLPMCDKIQCPQVMCMVFCPNGNAVDANGCPTCKCNPTCPCGQTCFMETGGNGTCQEDSRTCAVNVRAPQCFKTENQMAVSCPDRECSNFCEYGSIIDNNGCDTCECQDACPCGNSCAMPNGQGMGKCQNDGMTCGTETASCEKASSVATETSSNKGVIAAIVVIALVLVLTVSLLFYRRLQKRVAPEHTYADLDPAGYVAPPLSTKV